jgi:glutamate-1-semialdehyde aminotransferase/spore coat polysaccharide biosynthesis protein SpsF (cytidylyltransferase family)
VKVIAVIQARMGSTRLPGKVMMDLGGHPVLEWVVRACRAAPGVDEVWVATSTLPGDDVIETFCKVSDINCHRGSETDVLDRMVGCVREAGASRVLRITGDCPFVDPQVIGLVVRMMDERGSCDYCSNVSPRTYPDGLDVQGVTLGALYAAWNEATRPIDRDCVTTFIERNRSRFPAEAIINPLPDMHKERWVLDTEQDLKFCRAIVERWPWQKGPPSQLDILNVLDKEPALREINGAGIMNERYFDALAEEPIYERKYTRSKEALRRAQAVIPLGAQTFSKSYLQYPQPSPLFLSHGDGALCWDIDGNEYVDLVSALLPNVLGYRDPDVDAACRRQLAAGTSFSLATELEAELAEILVGLIPCAEAVRFGKSGTDVTSAAIRAARAFTGRSRIIVCGGYHGWQDWSVERNLGVPDQVKALTKRLPPGELPSIMDLAYAAAVIVEPECGAPFLRELREACYRGGPVLIFDEIITGFRYDMGGAQAMYGVTPDLATFGKAMANGLPLSAVVGRKDIMAKFEPPDNIFYSGTFFGEALSLAASIATIRKMVKENVIQALRDKGLELYQGVNTITRKHGIPEDVFRMTGVLSFMRTRTRDDQIAALIRREMVNSGTLIVASHNICYALGKPEIWRVLKSYDHAFGVLRDALEKGNVAERLAGASVMPTVRAT